MNIWFSADHLQQIPNKTNTKYKKMPNTWAQVSAGAQVFGWRQGKVQSHPGRICQVSTTCENFWNLISSARSSKPAKNNKNKDLGRGFSSTGLWISNICDTNATLDWEQSLSQCFKFQFGYSPQVSLSVGSPIQYPRQIFQYRRQTSQYSRQIFQYPK